MVCNPKEIGKCTELRCPMKLEVDDFKAYMREVLKVLEEYPNTPQLDCITLLFDRASHESMQAQFKLMKLGYRGKK